MGGKVIVLKGGLRGYHDAASCKKRGFECTYQPFSTCSERKKKRKSLAPARSWRSAVGKPPAHLLKHGRGFWMAVILAYMQRPNAELFEYMATHLPTFFPIRGPFVGVQVRKGDKNESMKYNWKDYLVHVEEMVAAAHTTGLVPADQPVAVYVATDDKEVAKEIGKETSSGIRYHLLPHAKTRGIGKPGQSVTNALLHKTINDEDNHHITFEVAADVFVLSHASLYVGVMSSRISYIATTIATAAGQLARFPVGIESEAQWQVFAPHFSYHDAHSLWEVCFVPFVQQFTDIQ
jgi:hypothetical protein